MPSDFCSTSRVNPKSETFAALSSAINTFLAAKSLVVRKKEREENTYNMLTLSPTHSSANSLFCIYSNSKHINKHASQHTHTYV